MIPNFAQAYWGLGAADLYKSLPQPAIAAIQKAVQLSEGASLFLTTLGEAYAAGEDWDEAQKILERLQELSKERYVSPYGVARIYAALGEKDDALHSLETAYQERAAHTICLKTDPRLDSLRSEPRFQDLLRQMNFPP